MENDHFLLSWSFFILLSVNIVFANRGTWIGLGNDAKWSNRDNWENGVLPGGSDNVSAEKLDNSYDWLNRQTAIVIDSKASCNNWCFFHYYYHIMPFNDIQVLPGADLVVSNDEFIDQCSMFTGRYTQTGGSHTINGDYTFTSYQGQFLISGGNFTVNGKMELNPDGGDVKISGGFVRANSLEMGSFGWASVISISNEAEVHILDEMIVSFANSSCRANIDTPLYMDGANFYNKVLIDSYLNLAKDWHMIFQSDSDQAMQVEVASGDWGKNCPNKDYFTLDTLQIGDQKPGYVMLVDTFDNYSVLDIEAAYVDTLIIADGSILDLNGYNLYYNKLIIQGDYQFLNGLPIEIPEPATIFIISAGALVFKRKKQ